MTTREFIQSGILEQYVLGITNAEESAEVEQLAAADPVIKQEIESASIAFEKFIMQNAIQPDPLTKPFLMATIDYSERIQNGEPVVEPPLLHPQSTIEDFADWLNRSDLISPNADDIFVRIIGSTPDVVTAIVCIKNYAPQEVHDKEYERFLIVDGSCDIIVGTEIHHLVPGDY
ncbi:MAG: hypothetical protein ABI405_09895, partial [Parafilimonas sp.]